MCNKPFQSIGSKICPDCLNKIDKDFVTVRDYIYENPGAHMDDVCEETGVEKAVILHLLKEGRLTLDSPDADGMLLCEVCKKPISTGRMCDDCKDAVSSTMKKNIASHKPVTAKKEERNLKANSGGAKISN